MEFLSSHARWSSLIIKKQNIWNRFKFFYDKYPIFIHWRKNRVDKMTFTFSSFRKIPANTCIISTFSLSFWTRCGRTCPKQCTARADFGIWKWSSCPYDFCFYKHLWNKSASTKILYGSRPENPDVIDSVYLRNNIQINIWYLRGTPLPLGVFRTTRVRVRFMVL